MYKRQEHVCEVNILSYTHIHSYQYVYKYSRNICLDKSDRGTVVLELMRILIGANAPVYHNLARKQPIRMRLLISKKNCRPIRMRLLISKKKCRPIRIHLN